MTATITVTVPLFTKAGDPLTEQQWDTLAEMGMVHLGDSEIIVPVEFEQTLPFSEIEDTLTGSAEPMGFDPAPTLGDASGPHSRACGVLAHLHGDRCSPDCPTCYTYTHSQDGPYLVSPHNPANVEKRTVPQMGGGDGSGVTVPDAPSPVSGPSAPEVADD